MSATRHPPLRAAGARRPIARLAQTLSVAGLVSFAHAAPAGDGPSPAPARALLEPALLAGEGSLRWFGLRIYDARLWVGPGGFDPHRPDTRPFALELSYARALSGAAIAERSAAEIARLGLGSENQRRDWLRAMEAMFPDVAAGDRIAGVFDPARGTRFYLNDRPIGQVADPAFGRAFFAIWFDPRTAAPALREALVGGAARAASGNR